MMLAERANRLMTEARTLLSGWVSKARLGFGRHNAKTRPGFARLDG